MDQESSSLEPIIEDASKKSLLHNKKLLIAGAIITLLVLIGSLFAIIAISNDDKSVQADRGSSDKGKNSSGASSKKKSDGQATADDSSTSTTVAGGATATTTKGTSASSGSEATTTTVAAGPVTDFSGDYWINFGSMHFDQSGNHATGHFFDSHYNESGTLDGTIAGNTFTGTWTTPGGSGPLTLSKSGDAVSGTFLTSTKWCGAKVGSDFPDGCGWSREWKLRIDISGTDYLWDMTTVQNGTYVTGTYGPDGRTVAGSINFASNGETTFDGQWVNGGSSGNFTFYLPPLADSPQQSTFQGHYGSPGSPYAWCGRITSASEPTPCLK